jgi:HK97 gp10 family phage protein
MEQNHINIQVKISDKLLEMFRKSDLELEIKMHNALIRIGMEAEERIKRSMQNTGKAHWFYRKSNGAIHWPSAPGYAPAVDEGKLINSIILDVRRGAIEIGSEKQGVIANYAIYLEEGTDRMKARPFLKKVGEWMESVVEERIMTAVKKVI